MPHAVWLPQMETQVDVEVPFAWQTSVHECSAHAVSLPQIETQVDVEVPFAMHVA